MAEVEERISRISGHKSVEALMIIDSTEAQLKIVRSNAKKEQKDQLTTWGAIIKELSLKARSTVRDLDPLNDLTFLRIRSKNHEIMVAPDKEYFLIVIQNLTMKDDE